MAKIYYGSTLVSLHSTKEIVGEDLDEKCQLLAEDGYVYNPLTDRFENPMDIKRIEVTILNKSKEEIKSFLKSLPMHSYTKENIDTRISILYDIDERFNKVHSFLGGSGIILGYLLFIVSLLIFFFGTITPENSYIFLSCLMAGVCFIQYYYQYQGLTDKYTGTGEASPIFYGYKYFIYFTWGAGVLFIAYSIYSYTTSDTWWIYTIVAVALNYLFSSLCIYFYKKEWWAFIGYIELKQALVK